MKASMPPCVDYFIASHVLTDGPAQALRNYLVAKGKSVAFAACPMDDAVMEHATVTCYANSQQTFLAIGHGRKVKGFGLWLRDLWFVRHWGRKLCHANTIYIGVNNLNTLPGIRLKKAKRCGKVIYYVIDYSHQRFQAGGLNALYQWVARYAARHADSIWNLSGRMQDVHIGFGADPEKNRLVPIGIEQRLLSVVDETQVDPNRLVIVSTLYESKGVQLAISALPSLPDARLVIVGQGPYESALHQLADELKVGNRVAFLGGVSRRELFEQVAKSRVALAPYIAEDSNYTYYADPAKPKEYLACGVPVVITRVPWIAEVIEKTPMGIAIDYNVDQLVAACRRLLLDNAFWHQCRQAALSYMKQSDWENIFDDALADETV